MANRLDLAGQHLGNYKLIHLLGSGTFADVYLAEHLYLNTRVAIKVLQADPGGYSSEDFLTEAQHLSHLTHPHIIRVFDFGLQDHIPFLVMDYAPHGSLRQLHPPGTRLALDTVVSYVLAIASALQYAHDQHLIHRYLKPENLLLGPKHEVLLSDFGLTLLTSPGEGLQVQERLGTLAYMAPEQIRGQPSPASDQYALSVLVYGWLSGQLPFHGSIAQLTYHHLYTAPAALREHHSDLPPTVEQVVLQALSKDPAQRFVDVLSFAIALEEASQALSPLQKPAAPLAAPASAGPSLHGSQGSFQHIPVSLTPLLGRDEEVQAVCKLLSRPQVRLLTLTGPPGVGKTRLAVQLGTELQQAFGQDVCFVPLAAISNPELVMPTVASTLGLHNSGERQPREHLTAFLHDKQFLLLLDNFEQVLSAAPQLVELLSACPQLKLLVTSRAVLHVQGEYEFALSPLALPDMQHLPPPEVLAQVAAVALFVQRAQVVKPHFQPTEDNVRTIVEICHRLDGLPLAIELAAVRIKLFTPDTLLTRLEHRLSILSGCRQDVPERQQTLRNAISWSYDLLNREEQAFLRRLCIFVGGCTLEAAEAVCMAPGDISVSALDLVASLVDHSLVQQREQDTHEPRLHLLEMIREYGLEALAAYGELERSQGAHAAYYLRLAEQVEPALAGPSQAMRREQLEQELQNIRAALHFLLEHKDMESALRLATALQRFWFLGGYLSEGRDFLERALGGIDEENTSVPLLVRARAYCAAGWIAEWQNDLEQSKALLMESVELYRTLGDKQGIAVASHHLSWAYHDLGNRGVAAALDEENLRLYRELGDEWGVADLLLSMGCRAQFSGEYDQARAFLEESLALFKAHSDTRSVASNLYFLGWVAYEQGDYMTAHQRCEQSVALFRTLGKPIFLVDALIIQANANLALGEKEAGRTLLSEALALGKVSESEEDKVRALYGLGHLALREQKLAEAYTLFEQSIMWFKGRWLLPRSKWILASCLEGIGEIALAQQLFIWTVRLFAAADAVRTTYRFFSPMGMEQPFYDRTLEAAHEQLGENLYAQAWAEGWAMTPQQALAPEARAPLHTLSPPLSSESPPSPQAPDGLTSREAEVLRLIARGLTNNQIARQLVLSQHTVNIHVQSIYGKLKITTRAGATRYALEHHLL